MTAQKANLSVTVDTDVANLATQILEQMGVKRKNIPHKTIDVDSNGHIIVDKDKDPELYDWAVNG